MRDGHDWDRQYRKCLLGLLVSLESLGEKFGERSVGIRLVSEAACPIEERGEFDPVKGEWRIFHQDPGNEWVDAQLADQALNSSVKAALGRVLERNEVVRLLYNSSEGETMGQNLRCVDITIDLAEAPDNKLRRTSQLLHALSASIDHNEANRTREKQVAAAG